MLSLNKDREFIYQYDLEILQLCFGKGMPTNN